MAQQQTGHQQGGRTKIKIRSKRPKHFNVVFHNDNVTTMDFVVMLLVTVFGHEHDRALFLMLKVHNEGSAVVGTYTYDIALSKAEKATAMAREQGFPLRITCDGGDVMPF